MSAKDNDGVENDTIKGVKVKQPRCYNGAVVV